MNNRLKIVRKKTGLNQNDFADALGISVSNISSYESGRRNPSDAFISLICSKYGINEEWLRDGTGNMEAIKTDDFTSAIVQIDKDDPKARQVILNYWHMSQQDKDLFWKFLDRLTNNKQDEEE
jgi:transcriptional regulator with XRE-family HTH domain